MKLQHILEGWKNRIWKNPHVEKVAKARLGICSGCEHSGITCAKCGCVLEAKIRSMKSKCPINKRMCVRS
jgi:hypothetical protein